MKPKTKKVIVEVLAEIRYFDDENLAMANQVINEKLIIDQTIASSGGYTVKTDGEVINIKPYGKDM